MRNILLYLLFVFLSVNTLAQNGILRGKVIDENTGEELIGTTVVITRTTNGTITDFDGNYSLENLEPGNLSVTFSYISYETRIVTDVVIENGGVTILNVQLGEAKVALDEVKVVARARQRTEGALQVLQRKSGVVLDGISAQQMSRLGDSDAASALRRVTGVSVEGGKYVYVRGLSDRYSKTTLNGAEIPGLDPNRNTVQMDIFPNNIIENMLIHKTFSPDLPGSFTGGHVDIVTKDFPEKATFLFSTSTEYNPLSNLNDDFLTYQGGKYDWLGFDDGTREIPDIASGQIPALYVNNPLLSEITRSFNKIMEPMTQSSFLNHSHALSYGNQTTLFGKPLGFDAGVTYSRKFRYIDNGQVNRYKLISSTDDLLSGQLTLDQDRQGSEEVLWAAMITANYKLSNNHKLGLLLLHNQSGESLARFQQGEKASDESGTGYQTRTLQFLQRGFTSLQIKGEHVLPTLAHLKVDWLSSLTRSRQDEPDLRYFTNHFYFSSGLYEINQSLYPVPTRYYRNMTEYNFDNKIDFTLPFTFRGRGSKLKFGAAFVLKNREFRDRKIFFIENTNTYTGNINEYLDDSNMDAENLELHAANSVTSDQTNSYDGYQTILGSYIMTDIPLMEKLRFIGGARFEYTYIFTESLNQDQQDGEIIQPDILPSINLSYSLNDESNLRMAYNRTLARPSFREMAPFASFDFVGDFIFIGNPNLKRTLIDNIDLRWEWFFGPGEMVSISAFYKNFTDPIERSFNIRAANPELTVRNVDLATVTGIEFELRKQLDFISFLKDVNIGTNITLVKSQVSIDSEELSAKREFDPSFGDTRVMFGQAPYVLNAFLSYFNKKFGVEMNIAYNTSGEKLAFVNAKQVPDIYEQPRGQLDFNIKKDVGERISIKFAVKNLLDESYSKSYYFKGISYIFEEYALGRTFSLGFNYSID